MQSHVLPSKFAMTRRRNRAATKQQNTSKLLPFNLHYFNVVQDTIQGIHLVCTIISSQNIGDKRVYDIVEQIKDV
jgi:hypothetical protein